MSTLASSLELLLRRTGAVARRACGWPGLVGLTLLAGAGIDIGRTMAAAARLDALPVATAVAPHRSTSAPAATLLLEESDLPGLQRELAARAAASGMPWPAAEYRMLPMNETLPAAYEVRCTLKGPYPAIRRFIVETLAGTPPAALREFSLARATADNADVEAHLRFVFFLDPAAKPVILQTGAPAAPSGERP